MFPSLKIILTTSVLSMGAVLFPLVVSAQERQGCFLVDENGQHIDLGSLCPSSDREATSGIYRLKIERRYGGIPVVRVTFNGSRGYEMLFDTGASGITITPEMARELDARAVGTVFVNTASDTNVRRILVRLQSVSVGGLEIQDPEASISPALPLGLLGQSFFGAYDITIKEDVIELRDRP